MPGGLGSFPAMSVYEFLCSGPGARLTQPSNTWDYQSLRHARHALPSDVLSPGPERGFITIIISSKYTSSD